VIYNGLSRRDESRLFIDINSKQKGVPNELLLDIKKLAEYETNIEQSLRELYDALQQRTDSALFGLLSPASREKNKISRVTFNLAIKPLSPIFESKTQDEMYKAINAYMLAFKDGLQLINQEESFVNSTVFRSAIAFFQTVAVKVKDKYGSDYSVDNFYSVLEPLFKRIKANKFANPGSSYTVLLNELEVALRTDFTL
jgi:CRISPR/Cas system CSM-associated protein Csm2 small subunit